MCKIYYILSTVIFVAFEAFCRKARGSHVGIVQSPTTAVEMWTAEACAEMAVWTTHFLHGDWPSSANRSPDNATFEHPWEFVGRHSNVLPFSNGVITLELCLMILSGSTFLCMSPHVITMIRRLIYIYIYIYIYIALTLKQKTIGITGYRFSAADTYLSVSYYSWHIY
jgi:hypothetical protein